MGCVRHRAAALSNLKIVMDLRDRDRRRPGGRPEASDSCIPGLSTYPQTGHLEQWRAELEKHGNPPWASCEGTALDSVRPNARKVK